jgi:hypothetical protein
VNRIIYVLFSLLLFCSNSFAQTTPNLRISYKCNAEIPASGDMQLQGCFAEASLQGQQKCFYSGTFSDSKVNYQVSTSFILPVQRKPLDLNELCLHASGVSFYGTENSAIDVAVNSNTAARPATSSIVTTLKNCPIFVKIGRPFGITTDGYKFDPNGGNYTGFGADCEVTINHQVNRIVLGRK